MDSRRPIQKLPQAVVNKIAAGEVIERPASVVKELLENSLDAGASRVDVSVARGGAELVRVADNGRGIQPDELPLAVASHATSKIESAEDLFQVSTLGFRGEALASIAEVSRLVLRSRPADRKEGAQLEVHGGGVSQVVPCGLAQGTSIEVHDLFFNTPVRRKFLKSVTTEMGHVSEAFTRLALAHPGVHFTLEHNGRQVYDLPPCERWLDRLATFFGPELAAGLIDVESRDGQVRLSGYVADPSQSRGHAKMQYLFLNGRHIRDRALSHALGEAYRGLMLGGRYPICFVWFEMPPDLVDVNVHPTKLEVRFQDGSRLYSQLLGTLRTRFLSTDLTARLKPAFSTTGHAAAPSQAGLNPGSPTSPNTGATDPAGELVAWAKGQIDSWTGGYVAGDEESLQPGTPRFDGPHERRPLSLVPIPDGWRMPQREAVGASNRGEAATAMAELPTRDDGTRLAVTDRNVPAMQMHDRYLVAETEDGVLVVDQHALHERILYERLRGQVLAGAPEVQTLLVPQPVDLSPEEADAVLEARDVLANLGVRIEPFGGNTVLVCSYPAILSGAQPVAILRELIVHLISEGKPPQRRDLVDELLHGIACKAAVKAGDRLSSQEVSALLQERHLVRDQHHCPHGRPTALLFTRDELDRQFKRV